MILECSDDCSIGFLRWVVNSHANEQGVAKCKQVNCHCFASLAMTVPQIISSLANPHAQELWLLQSRVGVIPHPEKNLEISDSETPHCVQGDN